MVDEYQDTNHLQADIVALLGGERGNVMVVGDDAQSIYAFRGADVRNIMSFPERFPGTRIITLEENYRSTQPILDLTNAIIAAARQRYSKTLFTRRAGNGVRPLLVPAPDERLQSLFVRQRILELHEEGVPLSRDRGPVPLLVPLLRPRARAGATRRSRSSSAAAFASSRRRTSRTWSRTFASLENPRDAVSWHRILMLLEGVGTKLSAALADVACGRRRSGGGHARRGDRAMRGGRTRQAGAASPGGSARLARKSRAPTGDAGPGRSSTTTGRSSSACTATTHPAPARDLEQFVVLAERFADHRAGARRLALEPPSDSVGDVMAVGSDGEDDLLTLSTVHSAKGLEWHSVFVISVADGRFPSAYCLEPDELEEERRLLYVACTRARENLVLTYSATVHERGLGLAVARPSRFLDDVPPDLLEQVRLIEE